MAHYRENVPLVPGLQLLALSATWGASYLLIGIALETTTPAAVTFARFLTAAALVAVLAGCRGELRTLRGRWLPVLLLSLVQMAGPMLLISMAERRIPTGLAGTLVASTPLWAALLAPALGGERPGAKVWAGLAVGLCGVALLLGATSAGAGLAGCLLVLLAGAGYAAGASWTARWFTGVPRVGLLAGVLGSGALWLTVPLALDFPTRWPSRSGLAAMATLGLAATGAGFLLAYRLIDQIGPGRTVLVTYLAPAFAVGYGTLIHHEPVSPTSVGGLALVLGGALVAARSSGGAGAHVGSRPTHPEPGAGAAGPASAETRSRFG